MVMKDKPRPIQWGGTTVLNDFGPLRPPIPYDLQRLENRHVFLRSNTPSLNTTARQQTYADAQSICSS